MELSRPTDPDEVKESLGGDASVGSLSAGDDLPQKDPVTPHVRLGGGDSVKQRLGAHPEDGELAVSDPPVVVGLLHVPRQAEVRHLGNLPPGHQNVPGGQISVDTPPLGQELHTSSNLQNKPGSD